MKRTLSLIVIIALVAGCLSACKSVDLDSQIAKLDPSPAAVTGTEDNKTPDADNVTPAAGNGQENGDPDANGQDNGTGDAATPDDGSKDDKGAGDDTASDDNSGSTTGDDAGDNSGDTAGSTGTDDNGSGDAAGTGDNAGSSDGGSDTGSSDDNKSDTGSSDDNKTGSGKSNPSYTDPRKIPSDITDPLDKIEYIRKTLIANTDYYDSLDNSSNGTWCFERKKDHSQSGTYEYFKITDYNGFYVRKDVSDDDKVIYLTFDCGYPSDLTVQILDTLAAHNAKASFFVTKMYLKECSAYAIRMKKEGHAVCNHTVTHTDLTNKSVEKIASEILDVAKYFYEVTGYEFDPYFRTPTGAYTKRLLTIIRDAGYKTVFWSIAYGDYDKDNQPKPGYVLDHFTKYHHNGAVALMHNDSTSNVNELDAVLTMLENEGYRFGLLNEI